MKRHWHAAASAFAALFTVSATAATELDLKREDGSQITMYLERSQKEAKADLLVLIQGSDCNSVAHNTLINQKFSKVLPGADVLTIEKYGITSHLPWDRSGEREDCPAAYLQNDSLAQRTSDYLKVLDQLAERATYENIVLLGGSEGAVIANIIAARADYVSASVALNGGGRFFKDDVLASMKNSGMPEHAYEQAKQGFNQFATQVLEGKPFPVSMSLHGYRWWHSVLSADQLEILGDVGTPTLIVQGTADQNVDVAAVGEMISELRHKGATNITYLAYEGMGHHFQRDDNTSALPNLIADIQSWLNAALSN
ncbi:alpha/beta hydrolase family protein [Pseudovibrio sp. SPO723]|uniref:alpha/beta hydrolase family protein n=1 Tax=Nesiotobacter zosterae TaxID=392721 RepID=UPI0029C1D6ED|nr:prolyl oligopeptidase family serine peptidase [Pseudovibrio sp. SPO723]MDX5592623.1 acyl-CoA thioester hydrolase/BAAT C-terminal domain-containing protein [Pseudovibrio sp. SPO723]